MLKNWMIYLIVPIVSIVLLIDQINQIVNLEIKSIQLFHLRNYVVKKMLIYAII